MKANALVLSLVLILVPLAGCSGTDTEVSVDLSNEEINDLIDENLEDVMNNTTVVVFQEYHNNTTIINQYSNNSTSNIDQSGTSSSTTTYNYNGSNMENELYVIRLEFNHSDIIGELDSKRDNDFTVQFSYFDYATNNDRTDEFTLPCSNYYDVVIPSSADTDGDGVPDSNDSDSDGDGVPDTPGLTPSYWQNNQYYWDWWDAIYNNTIRDLLHEMAYNDDVEETCRESSSIDKIIDSSIYSGVGYSDAPVFFEMTIPNGSALKIVQITTLHEYTRYMPNWGGNGWFYDSRENYWTVNGISPNGCRDLSVIVNHWNNDECGDLYGGWEEIELDFQVTDSVYHDSEFVFMMYYQIVPVTSGL